MSASFLLDLDGTLMPSHEVDNRCYWAAVGEVFSSPVATLDLASFTDVTDAALLDAWCRRQLGRGPSSAETTLVRERFLALLQAAAAGDGAAFRPHAGLTDWLAARPSGSVGIATGGWGHTARFKLATAGLDTDLPLACADDASTRVEIMRIGLARLDPAYRSSRPVFLGDSPWDVSAARALDWPFIGVATGERAERLRAAGATRVIGDFRALAA